MGGLFRQLDRLRAEVREYGFVVANLNRRLTTAEIIGVGQEFGELMPEWADDIMPFVTDRVILDLPTIHGPDVGTALEPFSSGPLRMHTEASVRPVPDQPWLIVLACQEAAKKDEGLQTLVISADEVIASLSVDDIKVLENLRVDRAGAPKVLSREGGRQVLRIRDFADPVPWTGTVASADIVQDVLDRFWETVYDQRRMRGIGWLGPSVMVLDNTRFMHGRSAGSSAAGSARQLRRVRVLRRNEPVTPVR